MLANTTLQLQDCKHKQAPPPAALLLRVLPHYPMI
jgi:hypothetical protein